MWETRARNRAGFELDPTGWAQPAGSPQPVTHERSMIMHTYINIYKPIYLIVSRARSPVRCSIIEYASKPATATADVVSVRYLDFVHG